MKISWLGHSSFLIEACGTRIITDPYDNSVGYAMPHVAADTVTCSHGHGDHACLGNVLGKPTVINTAGEHSAGGVKLNGYLSYHDDRGGKLRGNNIIYVMQCGKIKVCHMGDIGEECNEKLLRDLGGVNVLLIPVGGYYTIDSRQAKRYVDLIKPQIVIPMHYKTADCVYPISGVDEFTKLFDEDSVHKVKQLELDEKAELSGELKIIIPTICN